MCYIENMTIEETIKERGEKYGDSFHGQCLIVQALKCILHDTPNWSGMSVDKKEALDMIMTKVSRITYGDPEYKDNWHDIAGYALLVERACSE